MVFLKNFRKTFFAAMDPGSKKGKRKGLSLRSASSNNARDEENVSKKRKIIAPKTKSNAEMRRRFQPQFPVYVLEEGNNWVEGMVKKNNSIRRECDGRQSCSCVVTVSIKSENTQVDIPVLPKPDPKDFCVSNNLRRIDPVLHNMKETGEENNMLTYRYLKSLLPHNLKNVLEEENIVQYLKDSDKFETSNYDFTSIVRSVIGGSEDSFKTLKEKVKGDEDVCTLLKKATGDENAHEKVNIVLTYVIATICAMEIQDLGSNGKLCFV